jgi:hypothetical protein
VSVLAVAALAGCGDDDDDDDAAGADTGASADVCADVAAVDAAIGEVEAGGMETSVRAALLDPVDQLAEDVEPGSGVADEVVALQSAIAELESAAAALPAGTPPSSLTDEVAQVSAAWSTVEAASGCAGGSATTAA